MSTVTSNQPAATELARPVDAVGITSTRDIHKNGWLKKLPSNDRRSSPFVKSSKPEKMWVVFCIHDEVNAFLEFYENRRSAFSHRPTTSVALATCLYVSPNIVYQQENEFIFSVTLDGRAVKLAASSREQMTEWIDALKTKLTEIGVLQPRYNLYTKTPEVKLPLAANRDPNSPLPPPPGVSLRLLGDGATPRLVSHPRGHSEPSSPTFSSTSAVNADHVVGTFQRNGPLLASYVPSRQHLTLPFSAHTLNASTLASSSQPVTPTSPMCPLHNIATPPSLAPREDTDRSGLTSHVIGSSSTHFSFDAATVSPSLSTTSVTAPFAGSIINNNNNNNNNSNNNHHHDGSGGYSSSSNRSAVSNQDFVNNPSSSSSAGISNELVPVLSQSTTPDSSLYEPIFLACSSGAVILGGIRNPSYFNPPPPTTSPAPPLRPRQRAASEERPSRRPQPFIDNGADTVADENRRPLTLKEKQVLSLYWEINNKGGVRLLLPRKDCINTIAFVEFLSVVWVAGWKQRDHPFLYHSFHIGDRVLKVSGREVRTVQEVHRIIRMESGPKVEFIIARVPYGQVYALKRDSEFQDLGLVRDGNTADVVEVVEGGLASRYGLPAKALSCCGTGPCNWVLTEINGRPLNLFFKENEIHDRLNAVGRDISILVQPSDFVKALKKNLKSMRNYKDYIVQ